MPTFYEEQEFNIDVDDFLSKCSHREIKELIKALREDDHLSNEREVKNPSSPMEEMYERSLDKLHGAYHILGTEDIETIERIAKRF